MGMKIISFKKDFFDDYEMLFWVDTDIELTNGVKKRLDDAINEICDVDKYDSIDEIVRLAIKRVFGENVRCGEIVAELYIDI